MAYIGRQLARGENKLFDDISSSFNGSTTTFNLTVSSVATATATPYQLFVSLGGVMQKPNTDFTTAGNQITFTTAPAAGLSCWIMMQGDTIDQAAIPDASVTPSKISGSNFAFSGDLRLKDADGSHYVGFASPSTVSTNKVWTLPAADGSASQYLQTNGSGVLTWATVSIGGATGIDFNDNVKARWGTGNDLEVFHNGSNSVINDTGTGDLLLQVGGTTKATVSSTGFDITGALTVSTNATITGNLTVSGTTTTINTQTLDVEDKNVVIGKVSTPSDTTADGGGWTLKGATDKTFNWVNSTDAWTSSEHIHLLDGKKLNLGTDTDASLFHDGSNTYLTSTTGTIHIQGKSGENSIRAIPDGAVELYHNNVKKIETISGGINVTGAINVNGTALSTAPTITATASGSIAANTAVIVNGSGTVSTITGYAFGMSSRIEVLTSDAQDHNYSFMFAEDSNTNRVFGLYKNDSQGRQRYIVGTRSGSSITWGSSAEFTSSGSAAGPCNVIAVGADKFFIVYNYGTDNHYYVRIATTTSSNTATFGTNQVLPDSSNNNMAVIDAPQLAYNSSNGHVLLAYGFSGIQGRVCTFSGTTITLGALVQIEANAEDATYMDSSWDQSRAMMVIAYRKASNNKMSITYFKDPASGTTGLAGTTNTEDYTCDYITISYDPIKDVHFMVGRRTNDNRGFYNTAVYNSSQSRMDLSGNRDFSLAYSGANPDHGDLQNMNDFQLTYMPDQKKHLFTWRGNNSGTSFSSGNRYGYYMVGEAQGTANNVDATILFATGNAKANWTTTDYDARYSRVRSFSNHAIFIPHHYAATGSNKQISCRILQFAGTDATEENFIGFSDGTSYTNGQTVTVNVTGNTTTQSSLTAGEKYYVQNNGSLGTTADDPSIEAGIAVSTTKLLIKG